MGKIIRNGVSFGGGGGGSDMQVLTQAGYDALVEAGTVDDNIYYFIEDDEGIAVDASTVGYDNSTSGLEATDVQSAVDELSQSFQDGCDTIVAGCTAKGVTPASNSPDDIVTAISEIYTAGESAGKQKITSNFYFKCDGATSSSGFSGSLTAYTDIGGLDEYEKMAYTINQPNYKYYTTLTITGYDSAGTGTTIKSIKWSDGTSKTVGAFTADISNYVKIRIACTFSGLNYNGGNMVSGISFT